MKKIRIALIGLGNINQEVARQAQLSERAEIRWILDRSFRNPDLDLSNPERREREATKEACYQLLDNTPKVFNDPNQIGIDDRVDVVIEATGADVIELLRLKRRLWGDKVLFVTANKAMVANHLDEFFGVSCTDVRVEASVAAGLPLIRSLSEHIAADTVEGLVAILNGTSNFMLDQVALHGATYDAALNEAIERGYAEPGGSGDVDGRDAANKLRILTRIAFSTNDPNGKLLGTELVRGIDADPNNERFDKVRGIDFAYARKLDATIKLVGMAEAGEDGHSVRCLVHPALISTASNMARVQGPDNYVEVYSTYLGYTDMQGQGAGSKPTACAMLADAFSLHANPLGCASAQEDLRVQGTDALVFDRWMVRALCYDVAGVLAHLFDFFELRGLGVDEVFQLQPEDADRQAWEREIGRDDITPFAFTTTPASLHALREALAEIPLNVTNHHGRALFPTTRALFNYFPLIEVTKSKSGISRLSARRRLAA